jgi:hypothetical protein
MKRLITMIIIYLITILQAFASGYAENIYLCDLGILNSNSANERGVDFIQYTTNGRNLSVSSASYLSTALNASLNLNPSFDRWNTANGIDDVSINLESDYLGAQYFLEYCYTWDRILPTDNLNYDVTFITTLPASVPYTQFSVDTKCSLMANNGAVVNTEILQSSIATNSLSTDFSSMRCTVRLNFKEDSFFTARPHNGGLLNIDPQVTVKVSP